MVVKKDTQPGFQHRKLYVLEFDDPEWDGLVVKVRPVPFRRVLDGGLDLAWISATDRDERLAGQYASVEALAEVLHEWNVQDDDGRAVPATLDGLRSLDRELAQAIFLAWLRRVVGVSAPLPAESDGGATSEEEQIPMEPLSPSLAS